ncbi:hypothetical protein AB0E59_22395 [Lentzea sp. NPDC034063]|uniref:Uncharacterized protein n=1 Tax=Lentzea sokolovensis TaxID=3095429 RepID=A0ABU4V1S8_9PSEU|nr:hypothetical protein [Lentzea sp. BCCO 10_0061]MDX8145750.1 hypothetical protein [Lentzea sp. BCCO 10_0061]
MKIFSISRALGLPLTEGICTSASAQAMWHTSAHKPVALLGRERGTALRGTALTVSELGSEQPIALPVIDDVDNYTNALSAHQVRRLLPTP